jgi:PAS domain S-box-containing protein
MTHVLIVEDDEENRNLLRMLLEANAYKVTVACDGLEALAAARRDPPDVVVSDVLMPKMDGFALCRAWMQDAALKTIPFIFYSSTYVRTDDEQFATALGAVSYLPKPLEAEVFLKELRALLQRWAGHAAPTAPSPLDDTAFHALHESALTRTIEDKLAQLEATNRRLQESEARFRGLVDISSDFYWESDAEHRLTLRTASSNPGAIAVHRQFPQIGKRRWEVPYLSPDEAGWQAHRAVLDAHLPFRNFELSRLGADGIEHFASISGDPIFDASGAFKGYRGVGTDITERKRGEEALRRFSAAMDAVTDAIYLVDRTSMRFVHINDAACRMRKQTRAEMFALGPEGVLSTSRAELERIYDEVIAGGGAAQASEMLRTRPDGSQVWLELRRHAQRSGDRWTIATLVRDITARRKSEEGLRLFRALIDQSNDAIEVVDPHTFRFLDVNQKACLDLGYSREEMLALTAFDIDPVFDRSSSSEIVQALKQSGSGIMEGRHRRKDGSEFPVEINLKYVQLDRDYVLSIARDVSGRKQAEQALRASEEKFAKAFRASPMFLCISSVAEGRYIDVNDGFLRETGHTREEVIGHTAFEIGLWKTQQDRQRAIDALIKDSRITGLEVDLCKKSGEAMACELWVEQITIAGEPCAIWVTKDVSERKLAESKIQRLTQLYATLSECNQAIVRSASEEELFPQICRAAVQLGGMKMAWIGTVATDARTVRVAASAGDHADAYLNDIEISVDADSPLGLGPTGTSIREDRPVWSQDWRDDPSAQPWQERRARLGLHSGGSLPLHRHGVPAGALNLYAGEVGAFDEAARELLTEMATDIDFALENFARDATRTRAEQDLRAAEGQFRGLVEQPIAGIFIIQDDKLAYVNPRFAEIFGYACADEMIGRESLSLVIETERSAVLEIRRKIEAGTHSMSYGFTSVRKDGAVIEIGVHGARATHQGRPAVIGIAQDVSEKKRSDEQIQHYLEQLQTAFMSTVEVATTLSEMRDPYTAGHERHVGEIAMAIGAELGLDERRIEGLRVAGFLHDIGKITIPAEILSKPGRLSPIEYQLIKGHPQSGYDVLKDVKFPWPVAEVALQHHERMDGSGYPQGLKGEAILLEARIMAVADVMEAMSAHRPYRPGLGIDKALAEIERGRGSAYDPVVADACLRLFRERGYQLPE